MEQETELIEKVGERMETKNMFCPICKCTQVFVESESPTGSLICTAGCGYKCSTNNKKLVFDNFGYRFEDE